MIRRTNLGKFLAVAVFLSGIHGNFITKAGAEHGLVLSNNNEAFSILADSISEFSSTQGQNNWYYGYYSSGFQEFPSQNPPGRWSLDGYWTAIWHVGGHPHGSPEHWAVRRWISEVEGSINISGGLQKHDAGGGDGITGYIIVDGIQIWSQYIAYDDTVGVNYNIDHNVYLGSLVDFAIAPNVNDLYDSTGFTATIKANTFATEDGPIENKTNGKRYDYIWHAIIEAEPGDKIVAVPGIYHENIDFQGKNLTISSTNPNDPAVVAATIISGENQAVTFTGAENESCLLDGFTITDAKTGIYCSEASPTIANCIITDNSGAGIELRNGSDPTITNCEITFNTSTGLEMWMKKSGRFTIYNHPMITNTIIASNYQHGISGGMPTIANCTIVANSQRGISSLQPTVTNSIIYYNSFDSDIVQIESNFATVTYSDLQGGWPGEGNIDAHPCFVSPGYWIDANDPNLTAEPNDPNAIWIDGDYHLKSQAGRWNPASQSWVIDDITSPCIDAGDPNSPIADEPEPNGGIINMGAYGGTEQASLSLSTVAVNGVIIDQQLNAAGQGHTVVRLCGSYYEMGYAHGDLLADYIVQAVEETKELFGDWYSVLRSVMDGSVWKPAEIEQELDGMVEALAVRHPAAGIDKLDLKMFNAIGDLSYGCRSHTCWGRYVAAPIKTLSTRRLDFPMPIGSLNHHVLFVYVPDDGSVRWVNLGFPGMVTAAQGVNEFGTLVSLHDYNSWGADISSGRMPRIIACRYALTYLPSSDLSIQLIDVFAELQNYEIMTGTFLNYYAPEGHGGVMTCNPNQAGPDFYNLRTPQNVWHHGEAMITTNQWTNGNYTPLDEDFGADEYYNDETPKTHESHWSLVDPVDTQDGLQRLSVAYRGRGDMTIWADGRIDSIGRTPRLEYEWSELFGPYEQDEAAGFSELAESLALIAK